MSKTHIGMKLITACLLVAASVLPARAAEPTVADMLKFHPRQDGVPYYTPSAQEEAICKVKLDKGARGGSGWLLIGPQGQTLRRFFDVDGDNKVDIWSYYDNKGVEVYRETATTKTGKPDQYRWLNAGGTKLGIDVNQDGKIDFWKMISPEEVSQEILQALITRDFARIRALMITDAEVKELGLPATKAAQIRDLQAKAATKFQDTLTKATTIGEKSQWVHLESPGPECEPAEQTGMTRDFIHYTRGTIMYEGNNSKSDWVQIGEMIQVGMAWRIVDAPSVGMDDPPQTVGGPGTGRKNMTPELKALLEKLNKLDELAPKTQDGVSPSPEVVRYQLQRADLIEQIVRIDDETNRGMWIRQLADSLSTAAQSSPEADKTAYKRLLSLEDQIVKGMPPGHELSGFIVFRRISAEYADKLKNTPNPTAFGEVQKAWLAELAKFVQAYPKAEDTPDAMLQAAMVSEMLTKEDEAIRWYKLILTNFPEKSQATKATGSIRRLESDGKTLELTGPVLGTGTPFDVAKLQGKVVIVYYWAKYNNQCIGDFAHLKVLLNMFGSKGLELVCVNLDNSAQEAISFLSTSPAPGVHLFQADGQATGLDSPLAMHYGINVLPSLFLVGKDGKVISHSIQVNNLDAELAKLLK